MLREPLSDEEGTKWKDNVLGNKLSDEGHAWIIRSKIDIVKHAVNVVKLADEVFKILGWELLNDIVLDKFDQ